jgi:hypothetical protein
MERWSDGAMERWSDGAMERWSDGAMERWSDGAMERWSDGAIGAVDGKSLKSREIHEDYRPNSVTPTHFALPT